MASAGSCLSLSPPKEERGFKDPKALLGVRPSVTSVSSVPWQGRRWYLGASPEEPALFPASQRTFPGSTWASLKSAGAEAGQAEGWVAVRGALGLRGGHLQSNFPLPPGTVLIMTRAERLHVLPRALKSTKVGEKKGQRGE